MQKIITTIILILFMWNNLFASPYYCLLNNSIFSDKNQCDDSCNQIKCLEYEPSDSYSNICDTKKYTGFFSINGDTFAVTTSPVLYNREKKNLAKINNEVENKLIQNMLNIHGINTAWIGAEDKKRSSNYNQINSARFSWQDNTDIEYSKWETNQPDNNFDTSLTGIVPVYGEHWTVINSNGKWSDTSIYNRDLSEKQLHAVVRFHGILSCVAGKEKIELPDNGLDGMMCMPTNADLDIVRKPQSCSEGNVFDIYGSTKTDYLCHTDAKECIKSQEDIFIDREKNINTKNVGYDGNNTLPTPIKPQRKLVLTDDNKTIEIHIRSNNGKWSISEAYTIEYPVERFEYKVIEKIKDSYIVCENNENNCPVYINNWDNYLDSNIIIDDTDTVISDPAFDKQSYNSNTDIYRTELTIYYKAVEKRDKYTCPYTDRPCIKNNNKYYCSPTDCLDASDNNSYIPNENESEQGNNDPNNNGERDERGNCMGNLRIFPGSDNRCREPGTQNSWVQCCNVADIADADKPDITLSRWEVAAILWFTGMPWLILFATDINFKVCNSTERNLAVNRGHDLCIKVGSYCAEKWWLFGCVQKKQTYCCYDSAFSRAFNEAGMELLGRGFGTPENPYCGGFSPEELQMLSAMGISEHPKLKKFAEDLGKNYENKAKSEYEGRYNKGIIKEQIKNDLGNFK